MSSSAEEGVPKGSVGTIQVTLVIFGLEPCSAHLQQAMVQLVIVGQPQSVSRVARISFVHAVTSEQGMWGCTLVGHVL